MLTSFAKSELLSALQLRQGIYPCTLTTGVSANSYDAAPQPGAGWDSWDAGKALFRNLLVVVQVYSITTGIATVYLMDDNEAITTGGGAANTKVAATLATISAAGLYAAEINLKHKFAATTSRYIAVDAEEGIGDNVASEIQRYHSIRITAGAGTVVSSVLCIYGNSSRGFPRAKHTGLAVTYAP